jgi:hypothetical protein
MRGIVSPTSKTAKAVFVGFCSFLRGQSFGLMFWSEKTFFKIFLFSLDKGVYL